MLGDVAVAHELADDRPVFAFSERIVVGLPRPRLGEFDAQLLEQSSDVVIDILGARIGVKAANDKREAIEQ